MPVLTKISKTYQIYSGRDRLKSLNNTIEYLDNQIKLLKLKTNESIKLATAFARENDLSIGTYESSLGNDLNIENARVSASNKLRETELIIDSLKRINDKDTDSIIEFANMFSNFAGDPLYIRLRDIDYSISNFKINYISEPTELKLLKKEKMLLGINLKNKLEKFLNANKLKYKSKITASTRAKGIIEKYSELTSDAIRNNKLLAKLEDEKQVINLERAKNKEPWELILKPTLLDGPIEKEIFKELIFFTSLSFLTSIFIVLLIDIKKGVIYEISEIEDILGIPIIANLSKIPNSKWRK